MEAGTSVELVRIPIEVFGQLRLSGFVDNNIARQPPPVREFLQIVARWVEKIDTSGLDEANFQSEQLKQAGLLLANDPEFQRIYGEYNGDCHHDPEDALKCIYSFFKAINDAALSGRYRESARRMREF